jgi:hypothetical protein
MGRGDAGAAVGPTGVPETAHRSTPSPANLAASSAVSLKVPSGLTLPAVGALTAPGMCPATGSTGSVSPRYRSPALASSSTPVRATACAPAASSTGMWPGSAVKSPGTGTGTAVLTGRPAPAQAR